MSSSSTTTGACASCWRASSAEHGYRVTTAASAAEAQAKSESLVFDAIVLDVMMPGENGFDYARRAAHGTRRCRS